MTMHFRDLAERAAADGTIDPAEVLALRREAWPDGAISAEEADAILAINARVANHTPEWTDFVVEAVGDFLLNGSEPRGYVPDERADWLIAALDHDGRLDSQTELELLVRVVERALGTPERLKAYALAQIERAVIYGDGPTRDGGTLAAGTVTASECRALRRLIFAAGGDGPACVSQAEAELLFRIKDATLGAANAPEWRDLFVQGVANHVQGWRHSEGLTRERAAALETFMNDATSRVGGFMARMARVGPNGFASAVRGAAFGRRQAAPDALAQARADAAVTASEQDWLDAQMAASDGVDPLEEALLAFLRAA